MALSIHPLAVWASKTERWRRPHMRRKCFDARTLLACLAMLISAVGTAFATFPGRNGLIAFQIQTDAGLQIYTVRPNGKDLRQITFLSGDAGDASWSPDGHRIVFDHATPGECTNVAIMNFDGTDIVEFPAPNVCEDDPTF